eukprot:s913_g3.t1
MARAAVPLVMMLWVALLTLADSLRPAVPLTGDATSGECDLVKLHRELLLVAVQWNTCLAFNNLIFWVSLIALCCARGAVRYVFALACFLVSLWLLVAPALAGVRIAGILDTHACEHWRQTWRALDGPIACYTSPWGLVSLLICLLNTAVGIQHLRFANPAKRETPAPAAPIATPAATQPVSTAADVGEGKADAA